MDYTGLLGAGILASFISSTSTLRIILIHPHSSEEHFEEYSIFKAVSEQAIIDVVRNVKKLLLPSYYYIILDIYLKFCKEVKKYLAYYIYDSESIYNYEKRKLKRP